jgi:alpha,alpha-trehalose-phosphate synthase [UDP-forming]
MVTELKSSSKVDATVPYYTDHTEEGARSPYFSLQNEHMPRHFELPQGMIQAGRIAVVSNRLPIVLSTNGNGEIQVKPGSGGLITALAPLLGKRYGLWIGWPGDCGELHLDGQLVAAGERLGCVLKPVLLSKDEVKHYYLGFSNEVLWPLFHDLLPRCKFKPAYWDNYQAVNRKFAQAIAENSSHHDYIWVHDYHLSLVARELRRIGLVKPVGFFLHTPFPSVDILDKLPWSIHILKALLQYDLIGFQTVRDRNNFIKCAETLVKGLRTNSVGRFSIVASREHQSRVGVFPISIDFDGFARTAAQKSVADMVEQLRQANEGQQIILGVDRLDYSKGIPLRLQAFQSALERFEDLRKRITLIQIVVPSREDIPDYQKLKAEIEGLVSQINGKFAEPGWIPIQYIFRNLERTELLAYYRSASIALITPLKDGMNLVAKEYCATNLEENGVLILSKFAGAASQLRRGALQVNPYDIEGIAKTIKRAFFMGTDERELRMRKMRKLIKQRDISWWANLFLQRAGWLIERNGN